MLAPFTPTSGKGLAKSEAKRDDPIRRKDERIILP
jgi:hypothetical protein